MAAWVPENSFPAESVIKMNLPVLLFSVAYGGGYGDRVRHLAGAAALAAGLGQGHQSSTRRIMGSAHGKRTHSVMVARRWR